ncbi:MAG: hypothetical protein ORN21_01515, partial [Methylophilaceae bacterium]|nr:hypothetical protein [Methylophilaceae bacterium]
ATQEARPINEIGEPPSSTQHRNSSVQTVLQRSHVVVNLTKTKIALVFAYHAGQFLIVHFSDLKISKCHPY